MDLDQLLDDASRRPQPYVPDVTTLLDTGRRRHRHRVLAVSAVAVAAVTVGAASLLGGSGGQGPAPSVSLPVASKGTTAPPAVSAVDARILAECGKQYDSTHVGSASSGSTPPLQRYDFKRWTVAVSDTDASGTSAVLVSPDRRQYAECAFSPPAWAGGGEAFADLFSLRTAPMPVPTGWRSGFAPVQWAYDCNLKRTAHCEHEMWGGAGRLPRDVARVTVRTRDGFTGEAEVRDGFMAYRHIAPYKPITGGEQAGSGSGSMPPVIITLYDAAGRKLVSYNQNYLPPIPSNCPSTGGC